MLQRWDTATAEPMGAPIRHPGRVRALSFAVDGKSFFSGADDGLVRRFDCATGAPLAAGFRHAQRQVNQLALSPDGTTLAVATGAADHYQEHQQAELYLWDLATGKPLVAPLPHPGAVRSIAFAPDGSVVVTGCYDGTAQRWDAKTGKPLGSPLRHARAVSVVRFAPDGRTLATGSEDGSIRFWNARTGTPLVGTIALPPGEVFDLAFSRDGKRLAAASESSGSQGRLHIFALARSEVPPPARSIEVRVRAPWRVGDGATWLGRFQVAISPDATLVAGPGTAHRINLFDAATGQPRLVAGGADGPLWNAWPAVDVNVISPNGRLIATSSRDTTAVGEARLWDTVTGKLIGPPLTHQNYVSAIAFSPDSKRVATGCYDGTVQLWDTATSSSVGAPLRQPLRQPVLSLAYGPDGKTLAVGYAANEGGPNCVIVWDLARRERLLPPVQAPSYYVQFSPDGQRLLASSNPQLQFIDAATGHSPGVVPDETAEINSVVFGPDSALVLLSLTDGTVVMRQVPTGKHIGAAMRHPYRANFAVFSPGTQAQLILAGYEDGSVRLWDRFTQKPLGPPMPLGEPAIAGQFTPDGHAFVVSSNRCRSRRWPVPTEVDDDVEQLALRLQVHTGLTMGEGQTILPLTAAQWQARHAKLEASANAAPITSAAGDIAFHDSRAREAEEEDDRFGADWHLQRLAALVAPQAAAGPPLWQVYARRARIATNHDDFVAADADYAAAVAHGAPDQLVGWYRYRIHDCLAAKQAVAARWYADRALARMPDDWRLYAGRAEALGQLGNNTARDEDLTAAAAHGADATFLVATAADFARRGQWPKAAALVQQAAADVHSLPASVSRDHALVLLKVKDQAGYRALCRRLVAAPTVANRADLANQVAWICALGPGGCDDYAQPLHLAELAVRATGPDRSARASVLNTLGGVLLRAGRYPDAIARLEEAIALSKGPGTPHDLLFLALAHHHLGHAAQARQYLAQVPAPQPNGPFSFDRVELDLLEREARALIK